MDLNKTQKRTWVTYFVTPETHLKPLKHFNTRASKRVQFGRFWKKSMIQNVLFQTKKGCKGPRETQDAFKNPKPKKPWNLNIKVRGPKRIEKEHV